MQNEVQVQMMASEGNYGQLTGLINSKQYEKALDVCVANNIPITQELIKYTLSRLIWVARCCR